MQYLKHGIKSYLLIKTNSNKIWKLNFYLGKILVDFEARLLIDQFFQIKHKLFFFIVLDEFWGRPIK